MLLLRVTQADGQPLPVEEFTSRAMVQMICDVTGIVPKEVEILTDQKVVVGVEDQSSIVEVSRGIQGFVEAWYSLEQYIGLKEDKLSSTTVDFIRSEGNLETKHLYWFSKPKMC